MTLECDLVLVRPRNRPFLRRNLSMLTHAHAGRAIRDRGDVEPDITYLQVRELRDFLGQRSRLLKLAQPVRETLAQSQLDPAHALDPADKGEIAVDAVDHAGSLECS